MRLVISEFEPDPPLGGVIIRAADLHERAAAPVRRSEGPLLGVVLLVSLGTDDSGYADQPHFNRDFRELVGCAPGEFPFVQDVPAAT